MSAAEWIVGGLMVAWFLCSLWLDWDRRRICEETNEGVRTIVRLADQRAKMADETIRAASGRGDS